MTKAIMVFQIDKWLINHSMYSVQLINMTFYYVYHFAIQ